MRENKKKKKNPKKNKENNVSNLNFIFTEKIIYVFTTEQ